MEFEIKKCALVNIQRGKVTRTEGIEVPDGNNIKDIDETGYKYLGIIEGEELKHQEMKKIKKECIKRLKVILKSKLNSRNTVIAICTWAVPVIRYSAGIFDWKNDQKSTNYVPSTAHNANSLYFPCSEGGEGLLNLEESVNAEKKSLGQYLKMNGDKWLRNTWKEGWIKNDEDPMVYRRRTSKSWMEE